MTAFQPVRFSIENIPERKRAELTREYLGRLRMRFDVAPQGEETVRCEAVSYLLPDVSVSNSRTTPMISERTPGLLSDGLNDVFLTVGLSPYAVSVDGRGEELLPGSAFVSTLDRRLRIERPRTDVRTIQIGRAAIAPLASALDVKGPRILAAGRPELGLLLSYVNALGEVDLSSPLLRQTIAGHLAELTALVVGATSDTLELARGSSIRATRFLQVKADIARHLTRPDLSATTSAARLGLSARYVNMLFEGEGFTFSAYVQEQRLVRARRHLLDPSRAHMRVADIAFEMGFVDLSTFNRHFRRRFGATPSDIRASAFRPKN